MFLLLILTITFSLAAKIPEPCCSRKTVGDLSYTLVNKDDTSIASRYGCISNCVYQQDNLPGSLFCFAVGDLPTNCTGAVSVATTLTEPTITTQSAKTTEGCPDGWTSFGANCYKLSTVKLDNYEDLAEKHCQLLDGAHLASIHSKEENDFVSNFDCEAFWIGGTFNSSQQTWMWTDGSSMTFTSWGPIQPTGDGPCMVTNWEGVGLWNDRTCEKYPVKFLCKKSKQEVTRTTQTTTIQVCLCPALLMPVCGENGKEYANECLAKCEGVEKKCDGECPCKGQQEGERCGYCRCPPAYTAGDCAEGLICVRNPLIADIAGRCMKKIVCATSADCSTVPDMPTCKEFVAGGLRTCQPANQCLFNFQPVLCGTTEYCSHNKKCITP